MGKKKKKQQFKEPVDGWIYHPDGAACINCERVLKPCQFFKFSTMRVIDTYEVETYYTTEGYKVVKCSERLVKETSMNIIHGREYITMFIEKFMENWYV